MQKVKPYIFTVSVGICFNLALFFIKLYVGISTNSITIYIDSINNLIDTLVCAVAIIGFWVLSVKPNKKYPFGLGKTEDLVSFITAVAVLLTSASFMYSSLERILYPVPVRFSLKYTALIGVTAVIKLLLAVFFKWKNKKLSSPVIKNLQIDSFLDFFITLTAILSVTITEMTQYLVDGFFGMAISIILIISGIKLSKTSCEKLIGKKDENIYLNAYDILTNNSEVSEILELQCHNYGFKNVFCCDIKSNISSILQADKLKNQIKDEFKEKLNSDIIISISGV